MNDRKPRQTPKPEKDRPLMHDDIVRIVGGLEDSKVAAILAIAPTIQEVEAAEQRLDVEAMVDSAVREAEEVQFSFPCNPSPSPDQMQ